MSAKYRSRSDIGSHNGGRSTLMKRSGKSAKRVKKPSRHNTKQSRRPQFYRVQDLEQQGSIMHEEQPQSREAQ
ncbi:unnamed protein product [Dovyalis caffra]|uniref:Uncharacterized protein n=1 Tax=Dovyalis caffra TaxID=77055 RepID=A0AAV1QQ66_9ROSI|nr:unnamed protein product [Dovyalis caffra]